MYVRIAHYIFHKTAIFFISVQYNVRKNILFVCEIKLLVVLHIFSHSKGKYIFWGICIFKYSYMYIDRLHIKRERVILKDIMSSIRLIKCSDNPR